MLNYVNGLAHPLLLPVRKEAIGRDRQVATTKDPRAGRAGMSRMLDLAAKTAAAAAFVICVESWSWRRRRKGATPVSPRSR
jgi:hypothetical protein